MADLELVAMYVTTPPPRADAKRGGFTDQRYPFRSGWIVYATSGPQKGARVDWVPDETEGRGIAPLVENGYTYIVSTEPVEITNQQLIALYQWKRQQAPKAVRTFTPGKGHETTQH